MSKETLLPIDRFLFTLNIVAKEGNHLAFSWQRLYSHDITPAWVRELEAHPEQAEQLEAFVSRFGRMQDTIADKLLPRWLMALAETPGSLIETLNRAERLGVIENVEAWLEARQLRNRLVHEYMQDEQSFCKDLMLAREYSMMLIETYNRVLEYAVSRMHLPKLPEPLVLPGVSGR